MTNIQSKLKGVTIQASAINLWKEVSKIKYIDKYIYIFYAFCFQAIVLGPLLRHSVKFTYWVFSSNKFSNAQIYICHVLLQLNQCLGYNLLENTSHWYFKKCYLWFSCNSSGKGKASWFTALLQLTYLPSAARKSLNCFREILYVHTYIYICTVTHMHTKIIFWQLREFRRDAPRDYSSAFPTLFRFLNK